MSNSIDDPQKLPPSPRDWLAYRLVKIQQLTTRAAAEQLGISQTRVCQLIERVVEFMTDVAPGAESPEARARRVYIAESVGAERIDHLYGQALGNFQGSVGTQMIVRETASDYGPPKTSSITKPSAGDGRMLTTAARLAAMGAKLPVNTLVPLQPDEVDPPVEDCSTADAEQSVTATCQHGPSDSTVAASKTCEAAAVAELLQKVIDSRPVQDRTCVAELTDLPPRKQRQREAFFNQA
jgi:hypothetical protein